MLQQSASAERQPDEARHQENHRNRTAPIPLVGEDKVSKTAVILREIWAAMSGNRTSIKR
jgi:hypothetical protein